MTKSTITRERLEEIRDCCWMDDLGLSMFELSELARIALAAMDSEPVAWDYEWASYITCEGPQDFKRIIEREAPPAWAIEEGQARNIIPLYRHAQPALVVPDEAQSRAAFEQWCTVNIERNKWHPEFYAHLPAREQWAAWEACRAAMLNGGKS